MKSETLQPNLTIIAGPCSINEQNRPEIDEIAQIVVNGSPAIFGTRVVGLKSRTRFVPTAEDMGLDFPVVTGREPGIPLSIQFAKDIIATTGLLVASELMMQRQLAYYDQAGIPDEKLLLWNPSVDQLGWHLWEIAEVAQKHNWYIGIKNGKTLGVTLAEATDPNSQKTSSLEATWDGLTTYLQDPLYPLTVEKTILIHRGVDVPEKGKYRNALVHDVARRTKELTPGIQLFFDPSHSYGPKLRDEILDRTVEAMAMTHQDKFLYDGILVEAGSSPTDTKQHLTISELGKLAERVHEIPGRHIRERFLPHGFYQQSRGAGGTGR